MAVAKKKTTKKILTQPVKDAIKSDKNIELRAALMVQLNRSSNTVLRYVNSDKKSLVEEDTLKVISEQLSIPVSELTKEVPV